MNRERRKEAGKVFLDLSKYLATAVVIGGLISKEPLNLLAVVTGALIAIGMFAIGVKIIPPDKEV